MSHQITIQDGIINPSFFEKEQIRLLWILKEANDTTSTEGWDMRKLLRDRQIEDEGLFQYSKWRSTFGLVCKVSHGILNEKLSYEEINAYDDKQMAGVLDRIACINIKKIPGGSRVNYKKFVDYTNDEENINQLRNQIEDIRPDIVICGNTFHYIFSDIPDFDYNNDWLYIDSDIKYINGWHPNARIDHEQYFNDIKLELRLL